MSKTSRIVLTTFVTLGVIVGIYTSVEGASLSARQDRAGSHLVSGPRVNLDHYRESAPMPVQSPFQMSPNNGHGCESESQTSPLD